MASYGEMALVRGMSFLSERQAAVANNLANVDTTSFKRRSAVAQETRGEFHSMLAARMPTVQYRERSDLQNGTLRETGNQFDLAMEGSQWMRVRDQEGTVFYTRNGQLQLGADGRLVTREGHAVLDTGGQPIQLPVGADTPTELSISPNGQILDPTSNARYGQIGLWTLPQPDALVPVGKSLFTDPLEQTPNASPDGLRQGYLEGSNVDSLQELVQMIAIERSFGASQRALAGVSRMQENLIANILR